MRSIRPMNSSENQQFSEVFLFTPVPVRRKILKLRVCKKGAVEFVLQTAPSLVGSSGTSRNSGAFVKT
ncbi:hypothetical protein, partial [uncultured Duncaniella sp.]|uniref:hypothetical protein n=1 Tax=uncultured Duncaniella sp. TaxID=2768039 RepID=UPI0025AFC112